MKLSNLLVEGSQSLPWQCPTNRYSALELVGVVGVDRLTKFQHHVIGDVDSDRNRTHSSKLQTVCHPARDGCICVDPRNSKSCETTAAGNSVDWSEVIHLNAEAGSLLCQDLARRVRELGPGGVAVFAGNATNGQAVTAVWSDIYLSGRLI